MDSGTRTDHGTRSAQGRIRRLALLAGAVVVVALCVAAVPKGAARELVVETKFLGDAELPAVFKYFGDVPPVSTAGWNQELARELERPSTEMLLKKSDGVSAGSFLRLDVTVVNAVGAPAQDVRTQFEWVSADATDAYIEYTDRDGTASTRRWLSPNVRGKPMLVMVSVETADWSETDYTWFVPE